MIHAHPILAPMLALIAWTMIIMIWMMAERARAFGKAGIALGELPAGTRGPDFEPRLDPHAQWKAHNYNHLLEQPTVFYALCLALALMGSEAPVICVIAWVYIGLRIAHSLIQTTVNIVLYRGALFALSSLCLLALTVLTIWNALA